jgi:DNA-binding XRE family transcriptional regulator
VLRVEALPPSVSVHFGDIPATAVVCKPQEGYLEAVVPTGLAGDVVLTVRDTHDATNAATMTLNVTAINVPRPFGKYIDRQKLKTRREELGLTLQQVAAKVGCSAGSISHLETGRTKKPHDAIFEKLAAAYGRPLRDFIKQKR